MKPIKSNHIVLAFALLTCLSTLNPQLSAAPLGTAFTYQGRLTDNGDSANGVYDLRFVIFDSATNGSVVAKPVTNAATAVSNGLFTVTLDFGSGVFDGSALWLDIGVRTNGPGSPGFTTLIPRQALTPTPYAIQAANAASAATAAGVPASGIGPGTANINISGYAITASNLALTATLTSGQIAGAGTLSNNIAGNAATATTAGTATNGSEGVRLIRGNAITNYFGTGASAFTNALASAQANDTIRVGVGYYTAGTTLSVPNLSIIGSGRGNLNQPALQFVGGTRFNGGFFIAASNVVLEGFGIEIPVGDENRGLHFQVNPLNCSIKNVGLVETDPAATNNNTEPLYWCGDGLRVHDFLACNIAGHGVILKGLENFLLDWITLYNVATQDGECINFKASDATNFFCLNGVVQNVTIINTWANNCTKILFGNGDSQGGIGPQTTLSNIVLRNVFISGSCNGYGPIEILADYTNSYIGYVNISDVTAVMGDAQEFAFIFNYPSQFAPMTNIVFNDCRLFTYYTPTTYISPVRCFTHPITTNSIAFSNIRIGGVSYSGKDDDFNPAVSPEVYRTSAVNILRGLQVDSVVANFFTGNGSGLTFTNAAGASFRLIVNSSTNGFNFVPR